MRYIHYKILLITLSSPCSMALRLTQASNRNEHRTMCLGSRAQMACKCAVIWKDSNIILKQLGITVTKMYWLLGRKSKLSTGNKLLIYKTILKPIWTCGIQLSGMDSTSNIEILECFQLKALRMIVDAPWYVQNTVIRRDLQIRTVREKIRRYSSQYSACLSAHPNYLTVNLIELPDSRRLRRHPPNDLPTRILVIVFFFNSKYDKKPCREGNWQ
jgi:hypothetical protein